MSEVETKYAIRELLEKYSGSAARLDIEEYLSFFVPDAKMYGILEMFGQTGPLVGKDALREFFGAAFAGLDWLIQLNSITDITLSADGKSATTSLGVTESAAGERGQIIMIGRYDDQIVLTDQGWKFKERRLTVYKFAPVSIPEPVA